MHTDILTARTKKYEVFYGDDDHIEIYDQDDPSNGFIFETEKELNLFINTVTDYLEKKYMERG